MEDLWFNLIMFLVVFVIVFVFCYFFAGKIRSKEKKRENGKRKVSYKLMSEGIFLIKRYNLDEKKINLRLFNMGIALCNAFIIAFVSTVIGLLPSKIGLKLVIAFIMIFALIYALFEIYGRILKKKWGKDNERRN